ncbi:hypothetical protein CR513_07029, partial [Mucuna pruriens]
MIRGSQTASFCLQHRPQGSPLARPQLLKMLGLQQMMPFSYQIVLFPSNKNKKWVSIYLQSDGHQSQLAKHLQNLVCWRETEAVRHSHIILEPTLIPRLVESSRGRVSSQPVGDHMPSSTFTSQVSTHATMGFHLPGTRKASFAANQASSKAVDVPKGCLAVYVGEKMKRFVIPVSYLNQSSFQDLLNQAEDEFGYDHPMGGLTIPCREDEFLNITCHLNGL